MVGRQETALGSEPLLHFVSLLEKLEKLKKTRQGEFNCKEFSNFEREKGGGRACMCASVYTHEVLCAHAQTHRGRGEQRTRQEERQCISRVSDSLQMIDTSILKRINQT